MNELAKISPLKCITIDKHLTLNTLFGTNCRSYDKMCIMCVESRHDRPVSRGLSQPSANEWQVTHWAFLSLSGTGQHVLSLSWSLFLSTFQILINSFVQ